MRLLPHASMWLMLSLLVPLSAHGSSTSSSTSATYDVIIVGSGPGGLVAAEYLTRQSNMSVLMLEAGDVSLQATGGSDVPSYASSLGLTIFDIPGEFDNTIYNEDNEKYRVDWIASPYMWLGKLVGGCSSLNAALYFRTPDTYVKNSAWPFTAEEVNAGFDMIEKFFNYTETPSSDYKEYLTEAFEIVGDALQGVGYTAKQLNGLEAKNNKNFTFGHPPYAIQDGQRASPAKTFYNAMVNRDNFQLLTNAKVLYVEQNGGKATAVIYEDSKGQQITKTLSSGGVVMMAAGAISTPQVLMQSGIGPKTQLQTLQSLDGFDGVAKDTSAWVVNANVGQQLFDASVVYASLSHPDMVPFLNKDYPEEAIDQYVDNQSGAWAIPGPVLIAYETMDVNGRAYEMQTTVLPHGFGDYYETKNAYTMSLYVNNPTSRDSISFTSDGKIAADTQGTMYLSTDDDLQALQQYAEKVITIATNAGSTLLSSDNGTTIADWVSTNAGSIVHHFGGSCYTSSDSNDAKRCADETFKVIGTTNIYLSDASLLKEGTVNPYGFVMYIGYQAAKNVLQNAFGIASSDLESGPETTAGSEANNSWSLKGERSMLITVLFLLALII